MKYNFLWILGGIGDLVADLILMISGHGNPILVPMEIT